MITVGAMAKDFSVKKDFKLLTRIGPGFGGVAECIHNILNHHNWHRIYGIYDPDGNGEIFPKFCFLSMSAFIKRMKSQHVKNDFQLLTKTQMEDELEEVLRDKIGLKFGGKIFVFIYFKFIENPLNRSPLNH
jgi:hypothetical protein